MITAAPDNLNLRVDKSEWKRVTFGEVVRNVNETVKDPASLGIDRVIAMEHLDPGELKIARWGDLADGTTFARRVKPCQTLFGKRRAYQRKAAFADFDAICSGDILVLEADEAKMLPEFLPFVVQSEGFYGHALGTSAGSLSPRTNWRDLADYEFDLPTLSEQQQIADLLWAVERHRRTLVESGDALTRADMSWTQEAFSRLDWSLELSDVISPDRPLCYGVVQPGTDFKDGVGLIRVMDLESGAPTMGSLKRVAPDVDRQYRRSRIDAGDVLVSIVGTIGRTWVVTSGFAGCNIARALARISPDETVMTAQFLHWVLASKRVQGELETAAFESARKTLNLSALATIKVPQVSLADQMQLLMRREHFVGARNEVESEKSSLKALRSSVVDTVFGENK